jgi:hypothetical protein
MMNIWEVVFDTSSNNLEREGPLMNDDEYMVMSEMGSSSSSECVRSFGELAMWSISCY